MVRIGIRRENAGQGTKRGPIWRSRVALATLTVVLAALATAAQARAYVYFGTGIPDAIARANLDGSGVNPSLIPGTSGPFGIAVDGQYIYWANFVANTIGRARLDGSDANQFFITGANNPMGVAVDGQHIYWTNWSANTIGRANLDGTGVNQNFIATTSEPGGVAVNGQSIYWTNNASAAIGHANLDGTGVNQAFIVPTLTPPNTYEGVAVDAAHIYWINTSHNVMGRANLDGGGVNESFISAGTFTNGGVAVDARYLYWSRFGSIGRANLDGSGVNQAFINQTGEGVAVDSGLPLPASTSPPTISGTAIEGATLAEGAGSWSNAPTGYTYQWLRCDAAGSACQAIAGAIGQTYSLDTVDLATTLRVSEVAENVYGTGAPATSAPSAVVASAAPVNVTAPTVTGPTIVGQTLTATAGAWTESPSVSVQWLRCAVAGTDCSAIPGAIGRSYLLATSDAGTSVKVQETASNRFGNTLALSAASTSVREPGYVVSLQDISAHGADLLVRIACTGPGGRCTSHVRVTARLALCGKRLVAPKAHCHPKSALTTVAAASLHVQVDHSTTAHIRLNAKGQRTLTDMYSLRGQVQITGTSSLSRKVVFSYPRIRSFVAWTWAFGPQASSVINLGITGLPLKAQIDISCHGGGCPFRHRRLKPSTRSVRLTPLLASSRLTPGTRVVVEVTASNQVAEIVLFTIRRGAAPTATRRCQAPGAARATACA